MDTSRKIAVNTAKDNFNFLIHGAAAAGLLATTLFLVGSPVITGIAVGTSLALKFGLVPLLKNAFRDALPAEEKGALSLEFDRVSGRPKTIQEKLVHTFGKIKEFSSKMGIVDTPSLHFFDEDGWDYKLRMAKEKKTGKMGFLREVFQEALSEIFNKYSNAAAFSHKKGRVILSGPLVENLEQSEIDAVTAHEVGHIAARHNAKAGLISMVTGPATIAAGIFSLVTTFASWKNFGLSILGNVIGGAAAGGYAYMRGLDIEDNKKHKAEYNRVRNIFRKAATIGVGVAFGAPDLVLARALSLGTSEATKLIGKSYSRRNEFQADRLAAQSTGDPMALVSGLDKAKKFNIRLEKGMDMGHGIDSQKGVVSAAFAKVKELYSTHPTNEQRRAQMEKMALAMPAIAP